jgi:ferrochelatase
MAYGGPDSIDAVEPFMDKLMGRAPSAEAVERVRLRYLTIGGRSPLPTIASAIAGKLGEALTEQGHDVSVATGMLFWKPSIAEAIDGLVAEGVDRIVTVSLSPFDSYHSSGKYRAAVAAAAEPHPGLTVVEAPSFRDRHGFVQVLAAACDNALTDLPDGTRKAAIFSAHSLPASELGDDPYVEQLRETAAAVASGATLAPPAEGGAQTWLPGIEAFGSGEGDKPWLFAYQSRGMRPGDWLGPDVFEVVDAMAQAGYESVAFCPIGFATDHMETLYDLDVEAAERALERGLEYQRADVPNDAPAMIDALVEVVLPLL